MKSNYKLDELIGLEHFITDTEGVEGKLRTLIEDFYVEELCKDIEENANGEYLLFTLEKNNWDTLRAIKSIARALKVSHKRFGFAGTKDKRALTKQQVSIWKATDDEMKNVNIKDIRVYGFKKIGERITLGDSHGNKFRITVRNIEKEKEKLQNILSKTTAQLKEKGVPNYFGYQRFGIVRPNTHLVGKEIVMGSLEGAAMAYLGNPFQGERQDAYDARALVQNTKDFKKALEVFPKRLSYERSMLDALSKNPSDYAGALRRLHKKLRWMLVHAYQGFLFNKILSGMIERGMELHGKNIPLFGFKSTLSEGEQGEIEAQVLKEEGVSLEKFDIKSMPELSSEGLFREACIDVGPKFEIGEDEINAGKIKCVIEFDLPKGSYATVVLREFMKADPINY